MRITTRAVFDIATGEVLERESYEYAGLVAEAKGSDVAERQMNTQTQMEQQAFNAQQQRLAQLQNAFQKYTTSNIGYDPLQLAAMQTQIMNTNTGTFNQAGRGVREALLARGSGGGTQPVGGDYVRGISGLMGAQAADLGQNLNNLRIQNAQQGLVNRFNAGSLLSGNAAALSSPIASTAGASSNALSDYIKAANSGFMSSLAQGFGGALGNTLGGGNVRMTHSF